MGGNEFSAGGYKKHTQRKKGKNIKALMAVQSRDERWNRAPI